MVSHAGCGQEHEVRSGVECAGGGGGGSASLPVLSGADQSLCSAHFWEGCNPSRGRRDDSVLGEETERPNNAGCADEGLWM